MLNLIKMEFMQFLRNRFWLLLIIFTITISIILPRSNLTDITVIPGLVYFIMTMTLLLSIFGAEEARREISNHIDETISVTPFYKKNSLGQLLYWLLLSFVIFCLFYFATLGYIKLTYDNLTLESVIDSVKYAILCWFLPFFYSILIGYITYSLVPNLFSYLIVIVIWFLTMPYNSMIGFIPREWAGWLINGDPNITQINSSVFMESLEVNYGYYIQRIFMLTLLILFYFIKKYFRYLKIKIALASLITLSLIIPFSSPYVPYIKGSESLGSSYLNISEDIIYSDYEILEYIFHIKHGASNHSLKYTVQLDINTNSKKVTFALLNDFNIQSVKMNNNVVSFKRLDNLVELNLPEKSGKLEMVINTDTYNAIGPTTVQLLATSAWYPMHINEAIDTYHHGIKEVYQVVWESAKQNTIITNLEEHSNKEWRGMAYGPTILMGDFERDENYVLPDIISESKVSIINKGISEIFQEYNQKNSMSKKLPDNIYYIYTFSGMQANPEEAYIYPDIYPTEDIFRIFFEGKGVE